jgi:hypothetical protein
MRRICRYTGHQHFFVADAQGFTYWVSAPNIYGQPIVSLLFYQVHPAQYARRR